MVRRLPSFLPETLASELLCSYGAVVDWEEELQEFTYGEDENQSFELTSSGAPTFSLPKNGETYQAGFDKSSQLHDCPAVLEAVRLIGGTSWRCYRLRPGHGFRIHTDAYFKGAVSRTLYLNREWSWDWGGLLHVLDERGLECAATICPAFNLLVESEYLPHFVSQVMPWAVKPRYVLAVFGGA